MARQDPDPNVNPNITGQESWFNSDARFYEDVYIYGDLYLEDLDVDGQTELNNLNVAGISTLKDSITTGIASFRGDVFIDKPLDNLQVGILTTTDRLYVGENRDISMFGSGPRQGRVGIGTTQPDRLIDVAGDIKIDQNIYDSDNNPGQDGYFLSRDPNGIRWVQAAPDALSDGFFVKNEGINVGVGSFTIMNFIGTRSGGDVVNASINPNNPLQVDVDIIDHWVKTNAGIHTTVNVGININNPSVPLDVNGQALFRGEVEFEREVFIDSGLIVSGFATGTISTARIAGFALTAGIATFTPTAGFALTAGIATIAGFAQTAGIATFTPTAGFALTAGISTFAIRAGIVTFAEIAGYSTFSGLSTSAGFAQTAGIATFANRAGFAQTAGIATFATTAGFALTAGISTFARTAGIGTTALNIRTVQTTSDQFFFLPFVENSTSTDGEILRVDPGIRYNSFRNSVEIDGSLEVGAATTTNTLTVSAASTFSGSVDLDGPVFDINDSAGVGKTDYRLATVGTGVSWRPPGVQTKNILYVTKDGNDNNTGLLEGDAKATIGGACEAALDGDTIYVRPGVYFENNPVGMRTDVSITGQDLRLVTVVPRNPGDDIFHVRRGCLVENLNFAAETFGVDHAPGGCVAFPPTSEGVLAGVTSARSGYIGLGPINEGPSGRWRSPYVRNCTNFITGSVGMRIDGNFAIANYTGTNNLGQDLRSMVCDSFTQYNEAGIGVSITNKGYAQLVSIFTINCDIAIFCASGGQCDLTNSNSSFGNVGLMADGTSGAEFTGVTTTSVIAGVDTFEFDNVRDEFNNARKPFDGQGCFFKIDLAEYNDVGGATGIVTQPMRTLRRVQITNGGSGYTVGAPPNVLIDTPQGPESIVAELSANVSAAGTISSVDIIASGRNFLPNQPMNITFSEGSAVAIAVTDPILFTVDTATEPTTAGLTTVTFNEFIPYSVSAGTDVEMRRLSRIITSSHSFEYVGAGTDINRANPFQGGIPIPENEIIAINGGQVPFTSTDQKGNFRIGQGLVIDQTTSTISGRDFNRAIQANLTPLILALGG